MGIAPCTPRLLAYHLRHLGRTITKAASEVPPLIQTIGRRPSANMIIYYHPARGSSSTSGVGCGISGGEKHERDPWPCGRGEGRREEPCTVRFRTVKVLPFGTSRSPLRAIAPHIQRHRDTSIARPARNVPRTTHVFIPSRVTCSLCQAGATWTPHTLMHLPNVEPNRYEIWTPQTVLSFRRGKPRSWKIWTPRTCAAVVASHRRGTRRSRPHCSWPSCG